MALKLYQNKQWMARQFITLGKSPEEIGKLAGVSHTTIRTWLKSFGLMSNR